MESRGLVNLSNTCWFNSVIQCLAQTPNLLKRLQRKYHRTIPGGEVVLNDLPVVLPSLQFVYETSGTLTKEFVDVLCKLQNGEKEPMKPILLLEAVTNEITALERGLQHDSHEFLRCFLEVLNEEAKNSFRTALCSNITLAIEKEILSDPNSEELIKKFYMEQVPKELTPIERVFRGSLRKMFQCEDCKNVVFRKEQFFDIILPIPKVADPSLESCLNQYFSEELLTDDNKVCCENCSEVHGKTVLSSTSTISKINVAPKVLSLTLNRFEHLKWTIRKDDKFVKFPPFLNLTGYCTDKCVNSSGHKEIVYALYAVEVHSGSTRGGHYVSYRRLKNQGNTPVRNKCLPGNFIYTSDSFTNSVPESEVFKAQAYTLFYERLKSY